MINHLVLSSSMVTTSPVLHSSQILTSDSNGATEFLKNISGVRLATTAATLAASAPPSVWWGRSAAEVVAGDDDGVLGFDLVGVHESDWVGGEETN
ncbi:hypothetical protein LOK49_LG01G00235 [Camellia lanceoleosa]|uniref:Uncharacterized protein n=1 Tax=Camellia lanceoleosa TaxID=1840588 RepID=A0ACC0IXY0_9ERIC|nr:hypothetical protein LOK49_LG01G00235 [Camellia lanceoleosa]